MRIIVAGSSRPAWTGGGLIQARPGSGPQSTLRPGFAPQTIRRPGSARQSIRRRGSGLQSTRRTGSDPKSTRRSGGPLPGSFVSSPTEPEELVDELEPGAWGAVAGGLAELGDRRVQDLVHDRARHRLD